MPTISLFQINLSSYFFCGTTVRSSSPTAGVLSLHLGNSMWVSWWTKLSLGRCFSGFSPFSPAINFIPPFLHNHLIHFILFNLISPCDAVSGGVGRQPCYSQTLNIGLHCNHPSTWPCVGQMLRRRRRNKSFVFIVIQ